MPALMLAPAAKTDVGRVRDGNEDAVFTSPRAIAVADGVGGAAAGEVASRVALDAVIHLEKCHLSDPLDLALQRTLVDGNATIAFLASRRPRLQGMATTLAAVALDDAGYVIANVGDSRAYLLRDGALEQLTRDDSLVQDLALANRAGGRDNITVAVADVVPRARPDLGWD